MVVHVNVVVHGDFITSSRYYTDELGSVAYLLGVHMLYAMRAGVARRCSDHVSGVVFAERFPPQPTERSECKLAHTNNAHGTAAMIFLLPHRP